MPDATVEDRIKQVAELHQKICHEATQTSSCESMTFVLLQGILDLQLKQVDVMASMYKHLAEILSPTDALAKLD